VCVNRLRGARIAVAQTFLPNLQRCSESVHHRCVGAKLEGRHIGRAPLDVDRAAIVRDRVSGMSLTTVAKLHRVSRATVVRLVKDAKQSQVPMAA